MNLNTGNYKTLQTGTFYLNSERPLWILQDQKNERHFSGPKTLNSKVQNPFNKPLYYNNRQQKSTNQRVSNENYKKFKTKRISFFNNYKGPQIPRNYIPVKKSLNPYNPSYSRRYHNSKFLKTLPVFDAVPGEEAYTPSTPIFVYTGNKGRMLMNTMLSKKKYPMQEPVPGQILYPPPTLLFKPKPIVENFQQKLNVTMIPFYAYEAIDPRSQTTTNTPTVETSTSSSYNPPKKYKKGKQYTAFYSPQDVLAQPITDYSQYYYHIEHTTNSPLTLERPYNNHRFNNDPPPVTTTPLPHKKFEVTYNDGEDKFLITYEDDTPNLERPLEVQTTTQYVTTQAPVTYESYSIDKNYYAFPVYTMSKLMEKPDNTQRSGESSSKDENDSGVTVEQQRIEKYIDTALKEENDNLVNKSNEDTWFILNSR